MPSLKFPGQTVAGYDLIVETPELSGLKRRVPAIVSANADNAAKTLWSKDFMRGSPQKARGDVARLAMQELERLEVKSTGEK